ncbi:MAG: TfoX/Sxy family protein [Acutalibacteraceae bacterium]|nr:TfoX/Sxy family protein [Acutalibacteraceae bacterium]
MGELTKLANIGAKLEQQLNDVGIFTEQQLRECGSKQAWAMILQNDPSACIMRLSALEGALRGVRWHDLPSDVKADLKAFYTEKKRKD